MDEILGKIKYIFEDKIMMDSNGKEILIDIPPDDRLLMLNYNIISSTEVVKPTLNCIFLKNRKPAILVK